MGFKDVLQTRSQNVMLLRDRREGLKQQPAAGSFGAAMPGAGKPVSIFECPPAEGSGAGPSWAGESVEVERGGGGGGQVVIQMMDEQSSSYLESRSQAVDAVTKTIAELGSIYQELAVMVADQGEMLRRVDEEVGDSLINVTEGHAQLTKLWNGMRSNRGLMVKVFAVLMFFIIFWGTFFA